MIDKKTEMKLRRFIYTELMEKYEQPIFVHNTEIVTGVPGSDKIQPAIVVQFFPSDSKVEWIENRISNDIHKYCYNNNIQLESPNILKRDVYNGEVRYGIFYVKRSE